MTLPSSRDVLRRAARLARAGEPFVLASVVARTPPSSARPGDRAVVTRDGDLHGWLGGSCIDPVVRREARAALGDGRPRLLVFAPGGAADRPGARVYPMTCHSGGTVEIFLEPELPAPELVLYGDSPVIRALAAMAPPAGFRVRRVKAPEDVVERATAEASRPASGGAGGKEAGGPTGGDAGRRFAVVATMGEWDEDAAEAALAAGAGYVGLVASPRRAAEVRRALGLADSENGERLVSPAGLDLGAEEPGEIAVTILAEIVQRRRARAPGEGEGGSRGGAGAGRGPAPAAREEPAPGASAAGEEIGVATDPVCGMEVERAGALHVTEHDGVRYFFCCAGCRRSFEAEPEAYL